MPFFFFLHFPWKVSLKSVALSVALLCVPIRMKRELLVLISVSKLVRVCLFRASGKQAANLVLSLWGVELCLYIYLLTPDPPHEEERKTRTQTSLGETSLLFFHFLWSALGLCQSLHLSQA